MQDIVKKVHAHMPYHLLPQYFETIVAHRLNPEIYFSHYALQNLDKTKCIEYAKLLADIGSKVTFHAPFVDLRPGALDDSIRQASQDRIKQAFDLACYFHPLKIVCHPSFDERYYVSADDLWLENSCRTWRPLITMAKEAGTVIALENVYEKEPRMLRRLFELLASDSICFCFDTGHFNVFSHEPLSVWLTEMGRYLGHLHLHDNHGAADEHLPVGCGTFPFVELFQILRSIKAQPTLTLEAHAQEDLWQSMNNVKKMSLLDYLVQP